MGRRELYLIDTSAYQRLPQVRGLWRDDVVMGRVGMCWATELEILYSVRSANEYAATRARLSSVYTWYDTPEDCGQRAIELQAGLMEHGWQRSAGVPDLIVAVTAAAQRLTVLHYDRDFETIAKVTGQPTRWLAPPGTLD